MKRGLNRKRKNEIGQVSEGNIRSAREKKRMREKRSERSARMWKRKKNEQKSTKVQKGERDRKSSKKAKDNESEEKTQSKWIEINPLASHAASFFDANRKKHYLNIYTLFLIKLITKMSPSPKNHTTPHQLFSFNWELIQ